ncbi:peptide ABC transporter substrate-binding protein [Phenylobacterium deserti]|uniref:Peptide ABC transporter substrate-binding protein n=1 Tax=Phenylobacterium deserti TaxID=1914756 RepID=A0A328ATK2_9CAUL|nr:peptide ABC transporter substrate-binding protein [Phenylobacterium deserti]RAK57561.1 peptide ABC transporter substrate-binding protein [Phenylobacterium deserti]
MHATRRRGGRALGLLAALALLSACQGKDQRPACPAGQACLEYGNDAEPSTLDPHLATSTQELRLIGDLFMGLTTEDAQGRPMPGMAERWETSPDGLTWTFHLRPARWSDGQPVTAEDFVFALRRVLDPKTGSPSAFLAQVIRNGRAISEGELAPAALGARALGPQTLELTLEHPAPYLPQLASHASFYPVPRHVVARFGDGWIQPGRLVGNGPFRLQAWRLGDKVTAVKNPLFFDAANVCLDRINYYPTVDLVSAERRVMSGELDLNTNFQSNRIERLKREMPGFVRTHVSLATTYIAFNQDGLPALKDIRVRRALSMVVDREFITAKLLRAGQAPAYSFVPTVTANYVPGVHSGWAGQSYAARQAQARQLLTQAGYGPDRPLRIEIKGSNNPEMGLMLEAVQADWQAIGVQARIAQAEHAVTLAAYRNRDFQVGVANWYADFNDPVSFLGILRSDTGTQNYTGYRNPAFDRLLEAADAEADLGRRARLLGQAEQLMLDEEAMIPVFFIVNRGLVSPKVTGWVDNAENFHRARWVCLKR